MATRKKFSPEYKHEAVQLTESSDQSVSQVARELGISPNILSRWCREAKENGRKAFPGVGKPRDEEIANLKRELARLKKERDFLQEAAAFFAKVSK
jgi:transposase